MAAIWYGAFVRKNGWLLQLASWLRRPSRPATTTTSAAPTTAPIMAATTTTTTKHPASWIPLYGQDELQKGWIGGDG